MSMRGTILGDSRDAIRRAAARRGAVRIALFGSAARGEDTDTSDCDFLVDFAPGASLADLVILPGHERGIRRPQPPPGSAQRQVRRQPRHRRTPPPAAADLDVANPHTRPAPRPDSLRAGRPAARLSRLRTPSAGPTRVRFGHTCSPLRGPPSTATGRRQQPPTSRPAVLAADDRRGRIVHLVQFAKNWAHTAPAERAATLKPRTPETGAPAKRGPLGLLARPTRRNPRPAGPAICGHRTPRGRRCRQRRPAEPGANCAADTPASANPHPPAGRPAETAGNRRRPRLPLAGAGIRSPSLAQVSPSADRTAAADADSRTPANPTPHLPHLPHPPKQQGGASRLHPPPPGNPRAAARPPR